MVDAGTDLCLVIVCDCLAVCCLLFLSPVALVHMQAWHTARWLRGGGRLPLHQLGQWRKRRNAALHCGAVNPRSCNTCKLSCGSTLDCCT